MAPTKLRNKPKPCVSVLVHSSLCEWDGVGVSVDPLIKLSDTSKNPFLIDDYEKKVEIRIRFLFVLLFIV